MNINELYQQAVKHQKDHDCSAYPYELGAKLVDVLERNTPTKILEIGTGMGYTAALMAVHNPRVVIETIEKDSEHAHIARRFLEKQDVGDRVQVVNELAEQYLSSLNSQYDFIFFDGYQIHYEFLPHYERLLKPGGILYLANNHLQSKTSDRFFAELQNGQRWEVVEQFADTTIACRKSA
jgi:predicted O-methyltransferase YrrM